MRACQCSSPARSTAARSCALVKAISGLRVRSGGDGADASPPRCRRAGVGPGDPRLALARRGDERREGRPHRPARCGPALLRQARLLRRAGAGAEGRAHVAVRGGRQRRHRRGDARRRRLQAEQLAQQIAVGVRERQGAARAEVTIAARYPEYKPAPVSGIATQEIYTLLGSAVATARGTRRLVGVAAQGMTASPRAQQLAAARSRELLAADGFTADQIAGIFEAVPVATHDQRGLGTLHLGLPEDCDTDVDAAELLAIVEGSMSSEIYELMKRSDEGAVVETAHGRPRFVEDCVREALRGAIERFGGLHDDAFVSARQENLETIREHNLVAERCGLIRELRRERDTGVHAGHHTTMREWLDAAG